MMKLNILALAAVLAPIMSSALECGGTFTTDCVDDIRYDDSVGYDLVDESPFWARATGLYKGFVSSYSGDPPRLDGGNETRRLTFINVTVEGSRVYQHTYQFAGGFGFGLNAATDNSIQMSDVYATSTFEKDGTTVELGRSYSYGPQAGAPFTVSKHGDDKFTTLTVDANTRYGGGAVDGLVANFAQEMVACLGKAGSIESGPCDQLSAQTDLFLKYTGEVQIYSVARLSAQRLTSAFWLSELKTAISGSDKAGEIDPLVDTCATQNCPTEEQWQTQDPYYNESPYQQPQASLTGGAIALITILSIVVVAAVLYLIYRMNMKKQERRLTMAFA